MRFIRSGLFATLLLPFAAYVVPPMPPQSVDLHVASSVAPAVDDHADTLSTTVRDPSHPDEPWVVTTYRRKDESLESFIRRHRDLVESVRRALQ